MLKFKTTLSLVVAQRPMHKWAGGAAAASPLPTLGAGVEKAQITLLYIRSFVYYICVHLLNIYRTISQNNTIGYSNAKLLSRCALL